MSLPPFAVFTRAIGPKVVLAIPLGILALCVGLIVAAQSGSESAKDQLTTVTSPPTTIMLDFSRPAVGPLGVVVDEGQTTTTAPVPLPEIWVPAHVLPAASSVAARSIIGSRLEEVQLAPGDLDTVMARYREALAATGWTVNQKNTSSPGVWGVFNLYRNDGSGCPDGCSVQFTSQNNQTAAFLQIEL